MLSVYRTPQERVQIVMEGVRMAVQNARRYRRDGDEINARAAFARAYGYLGYARMFRRMG